MGRAKPISTIALISALSACAVSAPLSLESTGTIRNTPHAVVVTVSTEDMTPNRAVFGGALVKAFAQNSLLISDEGALLTDFAISVGNASDGILSGASQSAEGAPDWIAQPRRRDSFDKCDAKRMRGTLVLIDRASSTPVYRGTATRIECDFNDRDIENLAKALVKDATSGVGSTAPAVNTD